MSKPGGPFTVVQRQRGTMGRCAFCDTEGWLYAVVQLRPGATVEHPLVAARPRRVCDPHCGFRLALRLNREAQHQE